MANLSAHSGSGAVNGWWTDVQPPAPSPVNKGASTTHRNDHWPGSMRPRRWPISSRAAPSSSRAWAGVPAAKKTQSPGAAPAAPARRSEEHTSELQSRENLVCRLLLEKKKKTKKYNKKKKKKKKKKKNIKKKKKKR